MPSHRRAGPRRRSRGSGRRARAWATKRYAQKVDGWLRARHLRELFDVEITTERGRPALSYRFEARAWARLQRTLLGKTLRCSRTTTTGAMPRLCVPTAASTTSRRPSGR